MNNNSALVIVILAIAVAVLAFVAWDRRRPVEPSTDSINKTGQEFHNAVAP